MKKIILSLFLIATSMTISRLSAYCISNKSKETINIKVYSSAAKQVEKTNHKITPGNKECLSWKKLASDRKKEFYWVATSKNWVGEGYFPIGGQITFGPSPEKFGVQGSGYGIGFLFPDGIYPWPYTHSPWNRPRAPKPWQFKKR